MTEHPILFSAPMIRAILDGRKTQTRRVMKPQPEWVKDGVMYWRGTAGMIHAHKCPHGSPGDTLWVRETFSGPHCMGPVDGSAAIPPSRWPPGISIWYWADGNPEQGDWTRPRPSIHMPRWASRITLRITDVRVERLQDISDEDALAEGINRIAHGREGYYYHATRTEPHPHNWCYPADAFRDLWDGLNTKRGAGWDTNPWVWVVEFERMEPKP